ncbi:MAG: hypothetical protein ACLGHQ_12240 [Acidimicrobiia bacterium]
MGEAGTGAGLSRRDLIKKSAVAGAIVWTAPILDSSAAWGSGHDCNECDGLTLYSKYAPGNANVTGNQCLAPCPPVTIISSGVATACGLYSVGDVVQSGQNYASVTFSNQVRLIRTSIKSTNDCYTTTCVDDFTTVRAYGNSTNPECDQEYATGTEYAGSTLFKFYGPTDPGVFVGDSPGTGSPGEVRRVLYSTERPLNYIEIVMCLKGTSVLPPGCV